MSFIVAGIQSNVGSYSVDEVWNTLKKADGYNNKKVKNDKVSLIELGNYRKANEGKLSEKEKGILNMVSKPGDIDTKSLGLMDIYYLQSITGLRLKSTFGDDDLSAGMPELLAKYPNAASMPPGYVYDLFTTASGTGLDNSDNKDDLDIGITKEGVEKMGKMADVLPRITAPDILTANDKYWEQLWGK